MIGYLLLSFFCRAFRNKSYHIRKGEKRLSLTEYSVALRSLFRASFAVCSSEHHARKLGAFEKRRDSQPKQIED